MYACNKKTSSQMWSQYTNVMQSYALVNWHMPLTEKGIIVLFVLIEALF